MRTRAQLDAIRASGGMVAAMLKDDVQDTDLKGGKFTLPITRWGRADRRQLPPLVQDWAQLSQYRVDVMGAPVAMGSDFNGAAGTCRPALRQRCLRRLGQRRTGSSGPQQIIANTGLQYPFTLPGFGIVRASRTGFKTFDYNVDGLAQSACCPTWSPT